MYTICKKNHASEKAVYKLRKMSQYVSLKTSLCRGGPRFHLTHGFSGSHESTAQSTSRSVQPFRKARAVMTDRLKHSPTYAQTTLLRL